MKNDYSKTFRQLKYEMKKKVSVTQKLNRFESAQRVKMTGKNNGNGSTFRGEGWLTGKQNLHNNNRKNLHNKKICIIIVIIKQKTSKMDDMKLVKRQFAQHWNKNNMYTKKIVFWEWSTLFRNLSAKEKCMLLGFYASIWKTFPPRYIETKFYHVRCRLKVLNRSDLHLMIWGKKKNNNSENSMSGKSWLIKAKKINWKMRHEDQKMLLGRTFSLTLNPHLPLPMYYTSTY